MIVSPVLVRFYDHSNACELVHKYVGATCNFATALVQT